MAMGNPVPMLPGMAAGMPGGMPGGGMVGGVIGGMAGTGMPGGIPTGMPTALSAGMPTGMPSCMGGVGMMPCGMSGMLPAMTGGLPGGVAASGMAAGSMAPSMATGLPGMGIAGGMAGGLPGAMATGIPGALSGALPSAMVGGMLQGGLFTAGCSSGAVSTPAAPERVPFKPGGPDPAAKEEIEAFIEGNSKWLNDEAEAILRDATLPEIRGVVAQGTMTKCRDPVAVVKTRIRSVQDGLVAPMPSASRAPRPATDEEFETFMQDNKAFMNEDAEEMLRALNGIDRKRVISAGTLSGCRNPAAVIRRRIRQAREQELEDQMLDRPSGPKDSTSKLTKPATAEETDAFIEANKKWLSEVAQEVLRGFGPIDQKRVIAAGSMAGICNPIAVLHTRVKKSQDLEAEFDKSTTPKLEEDKVYEEEVQTPSFTPVAAMGFMYTAPTEVPTTASKFAQAQAEKHKTQARPHANSKGLLSGEVEGIGGVVEILGKKYGCAKGERLRCIGERGALWQFENGKSAPKAHEGTGWKWVLVEENPPLREDVDDRDLGVAGGGEDRAALQSLLADGLSAEEYLDRGSDLVNSGDLTGAEECFRASTRLDSESADAHFSLGQLLANKGDLGGAEDSFRAALGIDPNDADGCFALALILKQRGDMESAEVYYEAAIRGDPEYVDAYFRLGEALSMRGDVQGAVERFQAMLKIDPDRADAHFELGRHLKRQDNLAGAEQCYREVLRIDPGSAGAFYQLGRSLEDRLHDEGAEEAYRSVLKQDPQHADSYFHLAGILAVKGDMEEAEQSYRAALRYNPQDADARYALGLVLRLRGNPEMAGEHYRAALKLDPESADVHFSLGLLQKNRRDLADAEKSFRSTLQFNPGHKEAQVELDGVLQDPGCGSNSSQVKKQGIVDARASRSREHSTAVEDARRESPSCERRGRSQGSSRGERQTASRDRSRSSSRQSRSRSRSRGRSCSHSSRGRSGSREASSRRKSCDRHTKSRSRRRSRSRSRDRRRRDRR